MSPTSPSQNSIPQPLFRKGSKSRSSKDKNKDAAVEKSVSKPGNVPVKAPDALVSPYIVLWNTQKPAA